MGTFLNIVTALHNTVCANYVLHALPGSSLIPSFADPISILQTLELLGLDRRGAAVQAWGLLVLFLPVETYLATMLPREAPQHSAEHKPVGGSASSCREGKGTGTHPTYIPNARTTERKPRCTRIQQLMHFMDEHLQSTLCRTDHGPFCTTPSLCSPCWHTSTTK